MQNLMENIIENDIENFAKSKFLLFNKFWIVCKSVLRLITVRSVSM